jgi:hypothetical protein
MSRQSNVELLVPALRERLGSVLAALTARGFDPLVWETLRSKERALEMVAKGASKARGGLSMHCYGCACDVVCSKHMWSCRKHGCRFFQNLGELAEDAGLCWGGNWDRDDRAGEEGEHDLPHVQAVPATAKHQNAIRRMKPELIDTYVRAVLAGEVR